MNEIRERKITECSKSITNEIIREPIDKDENINKKFHAAVRLNVRKMPHIDSTILHTLEENDEVEITEPSAGMQDFDPEWVYVKIYNLDLYGYCLKKYLKNN